jgi:hypothetical protein
MEIKKEMGKLSIAALLKYSAIPDMLIKKNLLASVLKMIVIAKMNIRQLRATTKNLLEIKPMKKDTKVKAAT